ncbi:MAG: PEGA domain-containing protein [Candidatus Woesearchaeota archaeon]
MNSKLMIMALFLVLAISMLTACTNKNLSGEAENIRNISGIDEIALTGSLTVKTVPEEAEVFLDNEYKGLSNIVIDNIEPGRHTLKLVKEGYEEKEEVIKTAAGEEKAYRWEFIKLTAETAALDVDSNPRGATIYLNDDASGVTPKVFELDPGFYDVRLELDGYYPEENTIEMIAGEDFMIDWVLEEIPEEGTLAATSSPSGAEVYADGMFLGTTPVNFDGLSPGEYTLAFVKNGYKPVMATVEIENGETATVSKNLELLGTIVTESFNLYLGDCIQGSSFDHTDFPRLLDTNLMFMGDAFGIEESLYIANNMICAAGSSTNNDYGRNPYIRFSSSSGPLKYRFTFDSSVKASDVSSSHPLMIYPLRRLIEIRHIEDGQMNAYYGAQRVMEEGDSVEIDGRDIEVVEIGSQAVKVSVDGEVEVLTEGEVMNFAGFQVQCLLIDNNDKTILRMGEKVLYNIDEGDSLEMFGEPAIESDAEWVWKTIQVNSSGDIEYIEIWYNQQRTDLNDDDGFVPLGEGDSVFYSNNHSKIMYSETENDDREIVEIHFDNISLNGTVYQVVLFETEEGNNILKFGQVETDKVVVQTDGNNQGWHLWHESGGVYVRHGVENRSFAIKIQDENLDDTFDVTPSSQNLGYWSIINSGNDTAGADIIEFTVKITGTNYEWFGSTEGDADGEITYNQADISTVDLPYLIDFGVIIRGENANDGVEAAMDDDYLVLEVPEHPIQIKTGLTVI